MAISSRSVQPRRKPAAGPNRQAILIANGDLREEANRVCWPAQQAMEAALSKAFAAAGSTLRRGHAAAKSRGHGFIAGAREGLDVFATIDPHAPLVVAEAVWQYSNHVLPGLSTHSGPILTVANWSGQWPGLVGMLNLNGSLTKAGIPYSTLWADDFSSPTFRRHLEAWLGKSTVHHDTSHVVPLAEVAIPRALAHTAETIAADLRHRKALMGVFDEGCMGMFNAIIPDHLLHATGVFKERLSQSALYYETSRVTDTEARDVFRWLEKAGMQFHFGRQEATDLTRAQVLLQCKMYVATLRIADRFGCDCVGIQYQQGLKDLLPASDLVEGMLNDSKRPPVTAAGSSKVLWKGRPLVHFNEVDECAGLDGLITQRVHEALGEPVENTLHDIRWGDWDQSRTTDQWVWVFEISGGAPPAHFVGGWKGAHGWRQPPMYFRLGGSTLAGVSKPGEIVWSRIWVNNVAGQERLCMDIGRAQVVSLPEEETQRRLESTTRQWPIMHAITYGISRDQMMARHKANHIQVAYAQDAAAADKAALTKAAVARALGIEVHFCGTRGHGVSPTLRWDA
ncbi:MAG: fucose isomerase [Planctomycetia bacterium]|nr:fucose isomerase [Planctomycetia bacterium]